MIDKEKYIKIKNEIESIAKEFVSEDEIKNLSKIIEDKLDSYKPTIMVYGTYNAGKSTLINALFGKEVAKTGDTPETKEVHEYNYKGFTIYDTPGLNANTTDDKVTQEQFEKTEIVLFVLSSKGAFEEEYVYNKIAKTIKAKKPIIIIINNKSGYEINSIETQKILQKISQNLSLVAKKENIDNIEDKVKICMVNALSAFKARVENKKILLKKSNILYLENLISEILDKSGKNEILNTLNSNLNNFLDNIIQKIDNNLDNNQLKETEELITFLIKLKDSSNIKLKNLATRKLLSIKDELFSMFLNGSSKEDINFLIENTIEKITEEIEKNVNNITNEIKIRINDYEANMEKIYIDSGINFSTQNISKSLDNESVIPDYLNEIVKENIEKALRSIKKTLSDLMRGKEKVWIEKTAVAILVLIEVCWNIYEANKEHQEKIKKEEEKIIQIKNSVEFIIKELQDNIFAVIDNITSNIFNETILNFQEVSKRLRGDKNKLIETKNKILEIKNKI